MSKVEETVFLMENPVQKYNWGTKDYIPQLTGLDNSVSEPFAELWMGAHGSSSSFLQTSSGKISLMDYISANPEQVLGKAIADKFQELPFLFKILSAAQPLSIQVHPSRAQAKAGFNFEETQRLPLDVSIRNYKDSNHKPEMLLALTPFTALTGIRPFYEIGEIICFLRLDQKIEEFGSLTAELSTENLRDFFNWLLHLKRRQKEKVRNNIVRAATLRRGCEHPAAQAIEWICRLDSFFPDDIGIFAPIMMNTLQLRPGEAFFMEAGIMHAYLEGSGLEIMANSDNVLRCALTPKHIDIPELLKIAHFKPAEPHRIKPYLQGMEEVYPSPALEFQLSRFRLSSSFRIDKLLSAEILLNVDGETEVIPEFGKPVILKKGQSAFISQNAQSYRIAGSAILFRAGINPEE
ncbi:MAG: mannose-6-phosphate isomerase, class I [Candidatus Cloacimonetes bacterium]|nr:mannose-6-phosphate isomerase, class I [Candidatus Cloacimonadota bacterium]